MIERGFGRIVLLSSVAAYTGGIIGAHYASSKAGLHGLAPSLSQQAAGAGVTVNVVAPALIESEMLPADPAARERLAASLPVGRLGTPRGGRRPHRRGRAQRLPHEPVDPRRRRARSGGAERAPAASAPGRAPDCGGRGGVGGGRGEGERQDARRRGAEQAGAMSRPHRQDRPPAFTSRSLRGGLRADCDANPPLFVA